MAPERSSEVLRQVRTLFGAGTAAGLSDGELLDRFLRRNARAAEAVLAAEAAFAALVARHGPMVLGVCRRTLADPAEVDDAFQATFLVLVRKAGSIRVGDSLGRWLYGVARKVAARARVRASRRRGLVRPLEVEPEAPETVAADRDGLMGALDEELSRLPSRYRAPILLCHFEGLSHAEAAARLRCPVGTLSGRLTRARRLLRDRLVRRGLESTAGVLGALSVSGQARAAVPEALAHATSRAAARLSASGASHVGAASTSALALMNDVVRTAAVARLGFAAALVLAVGLAGFSAAAVRDAGSPRTAPGNADLAAMSPRPTVARPADHRPADEIVREIEALLKTARRPLPTEEWDRTHGGIVTLAEELQTSYPDDPRVGRYLPERWRSLVLVGRRDQARAEVGAALRTSRDPALRTDARFTDAILSIQGSIDGPAAATLAGEFAREAPGDPRAGELFFQASEKLDVGRNARIGLFAVGMVAAGLLALNRGCLGRAMGLLALNCGCLRLAIRAGELALVASLVLIVGLGVFARGGVAGALTSAYEAISDPARLRDATLIASWLAFEASRSLHEVPKGGRALLLLGLAGVAATGVVLARRRSRDPGTKWLSEWRRGGIGLLVSLSLLCLADAGLLVYRRNALLDRTARDYPDSFRGRLIRGERRRIDAIGKPFELEFTDAISGRQVSMKDLRGKVVVVDFWATWCGPCVGEIRELVRLYDAYHDKGVEFIGVSLDVPEEDGGIADLREFVARHEVAWPQYFQGHDNQRVVTGAANDDFSESWGVTGIPTVFLIDAEGRLDSTEARGKLEALIPRLLAARDGSRRDGPPRPGPPSGP